MLLRITILWRSPTGAVTSTALHFAADGLQLTTYAVTFRLLEEEEEEELAVLLK